MKREIVLILLLATFLRFCQLGRVPSGFHSDEAALGYNAYSILLTGKDEYGRRLPLYLQSFDDWKPAVYTYLAILPVKLFGLNELAVRFPSAFLGALSVIPLYFLIKTLTRDRRLALMTSFLLAVSPWHLNLSRVATEAVVALFFTLLSLVFFLLSEKRRSGLVLSFLFALASIFSYHSSKVFLPLMLILIAVVFRKKDQGQKPKVWLMIGSVFLVVLATSFFFPEVNTRFKQLSIFSHPEVRLVLEEQIREDGGRVPLLATRFFHNKVVNYSLAVLENFFSYLAADFLFLKGGAPQRVSVPGVGLLYLIELPFLIIGLYSLASSREKYKSVVFAWLFLPILLASLTRHESPNVYRTLLSLPALEMIVALGFLRFMKLMRGSWRVVCVGGIIALFVCNLGYFLHQYFLHQEVHRPWYRQSGYKQLVEEIKRFYLFYEKIVVTKSHATPYIFLLFYQKYDPVRYQEQGSPRDFDYQGFDKYLFVPQDCPLSGGQTEEEEVEGEEGVLYVNKGECKTPLKNARELAVIRRLDKTPVFKILEYFPGSN